MVSLKNWCVLQVNIGYPKIFSHFLDVLKSLMRPIGKEEVRRICAMLVKRYFLHRGKDHQKRLLDVVQEHFIQPIKKDTLLAYACKTIFNGE